MKNNVLKNVMIQYRVLWYLFGVLSLLVVSSCGKEFLEGRPQKSLLVPTTLKDFQALLDNSSVMNNNPTLYTYGEDDFNTPDAALVPGQTKASYLWEKDIYLNFVVLDWDNLHKAIFYSNVVLDGLKNSSEESADASKKEISATAQFYRARSIYWLSQLYCKPYNLATADRNLGVPIKLSSDVNIIVQRGSLNQTFKQIILDFEQAIPNLPELGVPKTKPSKAAAYGFLARVALIMSDYRKSIEYCTKYLAITDKLLDYNSLSTTVARPFPIPFQTPNDEITYFEYNSNLRMTGANFFANSALLQSYSSNDLRRTVLYNANGNFKGTYTGGTQPFGGIATDEIYLIRAECYARLNEPSTAMADLNMLLVKRWKIGTFINLTATSADDALIQIIRERRKELVCRGFRWLELRRLNQDSKFAVVLERVSNGVTYILEPNSSRYTLPIPTDEVIGSGIEQNDRD